MNMLIPSSFPETLLHYPDSISLKDSLQSPWMTPATDIDDVDGDHPPQHASDADFELAVAEYGLWLPDQHDLYLSEVLAMGHDELLASAFAEMVPKKGTVPNPVDLTDENPPKSTSNGLGKLLCATGNSESCHHHLSAPATGRRQARPDRGSSSDSALSSSNPRFCPHSPDQPGRKRKASSQGSSRSSKRTKARQSSAMQHETPAAGQTALYLDEEQVFLRLEKAFMTFGRETYEYHWVKRIKSWFSDTDKVVDIGWMFEEPSDAVSVQVRPDGVGHPVVLVWDGEDQVFTGKALDEKWITVSSEVMKAMHDNPLRGQFEGSRWHSRGGPRNTLEREVERATS
ncbi:hypothetical protein F5883DRAFT_654805 [Diaporthe sp. PMI_573]|nr:hypothetical protein F5883DRAFT_654805 [Diaporthaceae sp. PMI_573]